MVDTALKIKDSGICVVLAHAERYKRSQVNRLTDKGIFVQLNVSALAGGHHFLTAIRYLKEHNVVAFGSDIHGLTDDYAKFKKVLKRYGSTAMKIQEKTVELVYKGGL